MIRYALAFAAGGFLAAAPVQAAVRDCKSKDLQAAADGYQWRDEDAHRSFTAPDLVYSRPTAKMFGFPVGVVVDTDGSVACLDTLNDNFRNVLKETPQRRALYDTIATWRFIPFLTDDKPVKVHATVMVSEKVDFHYHEDMPRAPASATAVTLGRSDCYGPCPVYTVTVHADGRVDYDGRLNVDVLGRHHFTIPPAEAAALIDRLRARDVWSMAGNWVAYGFDAPTYTTTIAIGKQTRTLKNFIGKEIGMPTAVTDSENDIDATARTTDFIRFGSQAMATLEAERFPFRSQAGADLLARATGGDNSHDDDAMLRLIALGTPVTGGRLIRYRIFFDGAGSVLDSALYHHRTKLIEPLIAKGLLTTGGEIDMQKVDAAFRAAIHGGRLGALERLWDIAGDGRHPSLIFDDKSEDGTFIQRSQVILLLNGEGDGDWEGLAIAKWLAAKGANLRARNASGNNLLDIAADAQNIEMVRWLLAQGLDAREKDGDGGLALGHVHNEDLALLLIEAGSNPWDLETNDYSYREFAQLNGWARVLAWMDAHKPAGH